MVFFGSHQTEGKPPPSSPPGVSDLWLLPLGLAVRRQWDSRARARALGFPGVTTPRAVQGAGSGGCVDPPLQGCGESWLVLNSLRQGICNSTSAIDCEVQAKPLWMRFAPPFLPKSGRHLFEYFVTIIFTSRRYHFFGLAHVHESLLLCEKLFFFISQLFKFTFHSLVPSHRSTAKAWYTQEQQPVGVVLVQLEIELMDLQ